MAELTVIGKPVTRVDANEKVTGQAVYGYDLVLPKCSTARLYSAPRPTPKSKESTPRRQKQSWRCRGRHRRGCAVDAWRNHQG